jgi:hypothetical protein
MSAPHFDVVRACFWLVAFVIAAHVVAVLLAEGACIWHSGEILEGKAQCDVNGRLGELLGAALAAALAFAGGFKTHTTKETVVEPDKCDLDDTK